MFGKKKEKPEQKPFQLIVLTTEYLIEGTAHGEQQYYLPVSQKNWSSIVLEDARITSINDSKIPVRKAKTFEVLGNSAVALIPLKDASSMGQFASYASWNEKLAGIFYMGPYLFEGTLMNVGNGYFSEALNMVDVSITHANPNAPFEKLQAENVLVNTFWLHGRETKE